MAWISTRNRLPVNTGHYLVTCEINYYNGGNMQKKGNGSTRSIQVAYFDITRKWNKASVIAWRNLPNEYRDKGELIC